MEERMKIDEIIELIKSLKIDIEEYVILSTGALTIRGIWPDAGDLDIAVSEKGYKQLKENYNLKKKENGWFIVNEKVEGILDENTILTRQKVGDYYVQNIYEYRDFLKKANRPKDVGKLEKIDQYIKLNEEQSKEDAER